MLATEWNSDNRDAEKQSEEKMGDSNPYSAKYNPKDIHERIKASGATRSMANHCSERNQRRHGKLKQLDPKWNTYNG